MLLSFLSSGGRRLALSSSLHLLLALRCHGPAGFVHMPLSDSLCAPTPPPRPVQIRAMMRVANGGVLPRVPSCPQLTTASSGCDALALPDMCSSRSALMPGVSCPATPSVQALSVAAPQPSSSQASGESAGAATQPSAAAASGVTAPLDRSDATSGGPDAMTPASSLPAGAVLPVPPALPSAPGFAAAPLACMRLGATADLLPTPLHWPSLPTGMAWGAPVGCGVPPPLPGSCEQPAAAHAADLSIRWCPPGALPMAAATYEVHQAGFDWLAGLVSSCLKQ